MNYFLSMSRLLQFDLTSFNALNLKSRQYLCMVNVSILGLLYGLSASFFSHALLFEKGLDAGSVSTLKIILAGLPVAFLMHAGAALFVWVFLKAAGGKANFVMAYFDMGVAAIALWPIAPIVAAIQTGIQPPWLLILGFCLAIYGFAVNLNVIKKTFKLSRQRMALATSVTIIYIGCFLYLWVCFIRFQKENEPLS